MILANQEQTVLPNKKSKESKVIPLKIESLTSISVLIPVYNYNATKLVTMLHNYYFDEKLDIEIICCDDGSTQFLEENKQLSKLPHCTYFRSKRNKGRSQTRNFLAQKATKEYLLFLDCDVLPKNVSFFHRYINAILEGKEVVFGGWEYSVTPREQNLRWLFGIYREALPLEERIKDPYRSSFTSNILIKRNIFNSIRFESSLTEYGYEDYLFIKNLERRNIPVHHISNEIYHFIEDHSSEYLKKTNRAIENLVYLHDYNFLDMKESKLGKMYTKLNVLKASLLVDTFYKVFRKGMERNLTSYKPSLFVFDLYRISYFCNQMAKEKNLKKR
ncbi:glycosyltransferase family 2 protein [Neptunitalea lumnitzerae]|uniref:Glycosyl transferase n=1 Tax=Neptunitalea lumnitzerae TaxID=2965509 RepID=A0ABQ5MKY2_9FLAO|nr:glycosyltransferase [Neptunitalea sp. Y10]GLB50002.1 glycosyl transferase [Neptunitalea sp. Y10]